MTAARICIEFIAVAIAQILNTGTYEVVQGMKCNHLQSPEETNTAATMTACKARFTLFNMFIRELKLSEKGREPSLRIIDF